MLKNVIIVKEGEYGLMKQSKGDYDDLIASLKRTLKEWAEVEVVETTEKAENSIVKKGADSVIFVSRGTLPKAQAIRKKFPEINVFLFTGLVPNDEVILLSKTWGLSPDAIREIILSG